MNVNMNLKPRQDPIDSSGPTEEEKRQDRILESFMASNIILESNEEMSRRERILAELGRLFSGWVRQVALENGIGEDEIDDVGGKLLISGSHRLNVREPGADIDTVCLAPRFCTKEHFFSSLKERLEGHPDVTELNPVETAMTPLMEFQYRGVSIDLLFVRLPTTIIPEDLDILDDKILLNLDDGSVKSINGPRATDMIYKLIPCYDNFLPVLRCVRKWAKERGLYGNKLGYLGGINFNILVTFICQLYPNKTPAFLLRKFFFLLKEWRWPAPIILNNARTEEGLLDRPSVMPIITPAAPAMNSSYNVSKHTFEVIKEELTRGFDVVSGLFSTNPKYGWEKLFEPSDFFIKYNHYLRCIIKSSDEFPEDSRSWIGFVESRLRRLLERDYLEAEPLDPLHLYPVSFAVTSSSSPATSSSSSSPQTVLGKCYFIGFNVDKKRLLGKKELNIEERIQYFRRFALVKSYSRELKPGLDFATECLKWSKLPRAVFDRLGGYEMAKQMRRELLGKGSSAEQAMEERSGKDSFENDGPRDNFGKVNDAGSDQSQQASAVYETGMDTGNHAESNVGDVAVEDAVPLSITSDDAVEKGEEDKASETETACRKKRSLSVDESSNIQNDSQSEIRKGQLSQTSSTVKKDRKDAQQKKVTVSTVPLLLPRFRREEAIYSYQPVTSVTWTLL